MSDDTTQKHKHLCDQCNRIHDCQQSDDEDLEIQTCPDCLAKPEKKKKRSKNR